MPFVLCVLLWSVPGQEPRLIEYEDRVLALLAAHGAAGLTPPQVPIILVM